MAPSRSRRSPDPRLDSGHLAVVGSHRTFRAALWPREEGPGWPFRCWHPGPGVHSLPPPPHAPLPHSSPLPTPHSPIPPPRPCFPRGAPLRCTHCLRVSSNKPVLLTDLPLSWTPWSPFRATGQVPLPCLPPHTNRWSPAEFTARWLANGGTREGGTQGCGQLRAGSRPVNPTGARLSVLLEPLRVGRVGAAGRRQGSRRSHFNPPEQPSPRWFSHTLGPGSRHAALQRRQSQVLVRRGGVPRLRPVLWAVGTLCSEDAEPRGEHQSASTCLHGGAGPGSRARGGVPWGRGQGRGGAVGRGTQGAGPGRGTQGPASPGRDVSGAGRSKAYVTGAGHQGRGIPSGAGCSGLRHQGRGRRGQAGSGPRLNRRR